MVAPLRDTTLLDEVLNFLVSTPTPQQIIDFHLSERLQQRLSYLLHENKVRRLTDAENAELDEYSSLNHFMSLLKIKAQTKLAEQNQA